MSDDHDDQDQADDDTAPAVITIGGGIGSQPPAPGRPPRPLTGPTGA